VSQLAWSHPKFGNLIASCGFDRKVCIWKEISGNKWDKLYEYTEHSNCVNCVSFCPYDYGVILIAGSTDGNISIHEYKSKCILLKLDDNWTSAVVSNAHNFGVNCLCFASYNDENGGTGILSSLRFISSGNDGNIKIWKAEENNFGYDIRSFTTEGVLSDGHEDTIRDVVWKFNAEHNSQIIISGADVIYI
jgi:protein transport protein SEC13